MEYKELSCSPLITRRTIEHLFESEHRQKLQMLHKKN